VSLDDYISVLEKVKYSTREYWLFLTQMIASRAVGENYREYQLVE
jgi:hypothetical protein